MGQYKKRTTKGTRWQYRFMYRRKLHQSPFMYCTKQAASIAEREYIENGFKEKTDRVFGMLQQLMDARYKWLVQYRSKKYANDSRIIFDRLPARWKRQDPEDITADQISAFLVSIGKAAQANAIIRCMQATYNHPWGVRRSAKNTLKLNPWALVPFFPAEKKGKIIPTQNEIKAIISACDDPILKALIISLKDTGARINEMLYCERDDVSIEHNFITLYTRKKKGGARTPRRIPLTLEMSKILDSLLGVKYFFESSVRAGCPCSYRVLKKQHDELLDKAKVRHFGFHSYRHFFASKLAENGSPLPAIQRLLGHENATTTSLYLHDLGVECKREKDYTLFVSKNNDSKNLRAVTT